MPPLGGFTDSIKDPAYAELAKIKNAVTVSAVNESSLLFIKSFSFLIRCIHVVVITDGNQIFSKTFVAMCHKKSLNRY